MSPATFVMLTAVGLLVMAWYANISKRNRILCRFRRADKNVIVKWARLEQRSVIFDGRKYDVIGACIQPQWYNQGFIHMIFPIRVDTLDYTYGDRRPLDPNTLKPVVIDPEVRKNMNKQEWVSSYAKGFQPPSSKKQTILQGYLPWISIGIVILIGFYLYNNQQAIVNELSIIQNNLNAITQ